MCMICVDFQNMTIEQFISNTFETMKSIGTKHTAEVTDIFFKKLFEDDTVNPISDKHMEMLLEIAKFVKDVKLK